MSAYAFPEEPERVCDDYEDVYSDPELLDELYEDFIPCTCPDCLGEESDDYLDWLDDECIDCNGDSNDDYSDYDAYEELDF